MARYKKLIAQTQQELEAFQGYLSVELQAVSEQSIALATKHAEQLILQSSKEAGLVVSLSDTIPTGAVKTLLGFLDPDGPLYKRLLYFGAENAANISAALLEGVGLGYGADKLARYVINQGFGGGLTDALRMVRTSQVYAYREASRANYIANQNIVRGWIWYSALIPGRTCMSCVNQHGSEHGLDERLNDHHAGLCTPIPLVGDNPVKERGAEWFDKQPEATQKQMMGQGKYTAWSEGKISIDQLSRTVDNDVYGKMQTETPLKDLIKDE